MKKRSTIALFCLFSVISTFAGTGLYSYADKSVLSSGKWVKIKLTNSGIYKLTYAQITQMGFSDPSKVKVFGYGGAMLSEAFNMPKRDTKGEGDIPEVPVYKGTNFILFWAQGIVSWQNTGNIFSHTINPYSTQAYYFLTDSQGSPDQIKTLPSTSNPDTTFTTFDDYDLHEKDIRNVANSGREFYGEDFSTNNAQTFPFNIQGVTKNRPITLHVDFISKATSGTSFKVSVNNTTCINTTMPAVGTGDQYIKANSLQTSGSYLNSDLSQLFNVKIEYGKTNDLNCRLNYIRLNMERTLKLYNSFTPFRVVASKGLNTQYVIQNTNQNVKIWDISDGRCVEITPTNTGSETRFAATSPNNKPREFVVFDVNGSFPSPEFDQTVENQNLHGLPQTDMIIISNTDFTNYANQIADLHRNPKKDNLSVVVVSPQQIYNEFSSGTPDATAYRWFMKMFYDRATSAADKPKYLLLFGDGTYDNRLLGSEWINAERADKLLTYQSASSLDERTSYVCDDYFGFLHDNEGNIISGAHLDIGIGRFPVRSTYEAEAVVNKIIGYAENKQTGTWKNNLCFVADDGDGNSHMSQANSLTEYIEENYKQFIVTKIFLDSYKKVNSATGGTYPAAKKKLLDMLNSGVIALNYTGHGSTNSWAVEQIITISDIRSLYLSKLPLWVTATCDFSRFDDFNTSAGEEVILNPNGGGIGLITTTRVVYSDQNFLLNTALNRLLLKKDSDGSRLRLGDIIKLTKQSLSNENKLNFTLLGDPALKLNYAEYKMDITTINGDSVDKVMPKLSALSEVKLTGRILNPDGTFDPQFNGIIKPTVFDSEEQITALDNDKTGNPFKYIDRNKILFSGKDSVRNGEFSFTFTIPKDISYSNQSGRINLYGVDADGNEAQGYYEKFLIGGTNPNAVIETEGPAIRKMYLNNESFNNGDVVNESPMFVAELEDQSGLNVSGTGIGHDLLLIVDNNPATTYILNGYYEAYSGSSSRGRISYNIPKLKNGNHTMTLRAWDIQNNSSTKTIDCVVEQGHTPRIFDLYANNLIRQSADKVTFYIKHDRPNTNIKVNIAVYNLSGIEVWGHTETGLADMMKAYSINWNLKDANGITVPKGIYLYKATISTNGAQEATQTKKLIIQ